MAQARPPRNSPANVEPRPANGSLLTALTAPTPVVTGLSCPSCGSDIELRWRFSKSVVCPFCGQTNYINPNQQLDPRGAQQVPLVDYGSRLRLGIDGTLLGKPFHVMGRLRYRFGDGFWDEWLAFFPHRPEATFWLQEDDGTYTLFRRFDYPEGQRPPAYGELHVGQWAELAGHRVFITERSRGCIEGGEGELPFQVLPGEQADFVEGVAKGLKYSLEYLADEVEFNLGEPVPYDAVVLKA